jgi:hypothetical protein
MTIIEHHSDERIYEGPWLEAHLCANCGEDLHDVTERYWHKPCPVCGAVGTYCPPTILTSYRFICTYQPGWFHRVFLKHKEKGYFEWSGKTEDNVALPDKLVAGKRMKIATPAVITATGIASGLF